MLLKLIDLFSDESPDQFEQVITAIENSFYPSIYDTDVKKLKERFETKFTETADHPDLAKEPHSQKYLNQLDTAIEDYLKK